MSGIPDLSAIDALLRGATPTTAPAAQLHIRWCNEILFAGEYGWFDPETRTLPTQADTLFDLASVTKLFVVTAFMTLLEAGMVKIDQPVGSILPALNGTRPIEPYEDPLQPGAFVQVVQHAPPVDVGRITFRHLLTHTSGLPAWRPLFRQASVEAACGMALATACAYPTGERVVYSDIGLILLGMAIEQLADQPLDIAVRERVTGPLGLHRTKYLPIFQAEGDKETRRQGDKETRRQEDRLPASSPQPLSPQSSSLKPLHRTPDTGQRTTDNGQMTAPTEICTWRKRRVVAEVHDENAAGLGGVAGHAGLFSTAAEVAGFGQMFLDRGAPLLQPGTVAEMTRLQAQDGDIRRGLGFALWSPDPEASSNPLSQEAFGHLGFTGTSLWIDPARELVVALLTNDVYYGRTSRGIGALRVTLHRTIVEALDS